MEIIHIQLIVEVFVFNTNLALLEFLHNINIEGFKKISPKNKVAPPPSEN